MWLLTAEDPPRLQQFTAENGRPDYAMLSHTWSSDLDEVSFADMKDLKKATAKPGWTKIKHTRAAALRHELEYVWVDTCCIDKSSSAELSEAINSMFKWYEQALVYFVYLSDVQGLAISPVRNVSGSVSLHPDVEHSFHDSRWFTRGWTLQEILAPSPERIMFFSREW